MFQKIIISILEFKYSINSIYTKYKDAQSTAQFLVLIVISFVISLGYIFYFISIFIIVFALVLIQSLLYKFVYKKHYEIKNVFLYKYDCKSDILILIKYYFYTLVVRYAFLVLYILIKIIRDSSYFIFMKSIISRAFNFIFIYIFGFPTIVFQLTNKIYARINNSVYSNKLDYKILKLNLNSMYFFDFVDTADVENLSIFLK